MQNVITPKIGQSVFIPFVTKTDELTGKAERIKGAALIPFDKIEAVYAETERSNHGKANL
ncbi:RecT family recombinase [Klebsiella phage vB_Kpn_3]|nr:RecT family recombinase [Klebsiella phage vB_Kpn_3]